MSDFDDHGRGLRASESGNNQEKVVHTIFDTGTTRNSIPSVCDLLWVKFHTSLLEETLFQYRPGFCTDSGNIVLLVYILDVRNYFFCKG